MSWKLLQGSAELRDFGIYCRFITLSISSQVCEFIVIKILNYNHFIKENKCKYGGFLPFFPVRILLLKEHALLLSGAKWNQPNESSALPQRNVFRTKTLIFDDSLLNLQRDESSRRQSCIFQFDTLVNNMPQLSGTVFTAWLCCRPPHNKSSCLEMWTPSFQFGHPQ